MGAATAVLLGLDAVTGLSGSIAQGRATREQGRSIERASALNADLASRAALDTIRRGRTTASRRLSQGQQIGGAQRNIAAASGIDPNVGTSLILREQEGQLAELDALTATTSAGRRAFGLRVRGVQAQTRGRLARISSRFSERSSIITGGLGVARAVAAGAAKFESNPDLFSGRGATALQSSAVSRPSRISI